MRACVRVPKQSRVSRVSRASPIERVRGSVRQHTFYTETETVTRASVRRLTGRRDQKYAIQLLRAHARLEHTYTHTQYLLGWLVIIGKDIIITLPYRARARTEWPCSMAVKKGRQMGAIAKVKIPIPHD